MKPIGIILLFLSLAWLAIGFARVAPVRASSDREAALVDAVACADQYNSLVMNAKSALAGGDRNTAIDLLQRARNLIPTCPVLQGGQASAGLILSL